MTKNTFFKSCFIASFLLLQTTIAMDTSKTWAPQDEKKSKTEAPKIAVLLAAYSPKVNNWMFLFAKPKNSDKYTAFLGNSEAKESTEQMLARIVSTQTYGQCSQETITQCAANRIKRAIPAGQMGYIIPVAEIHQSSLAGAAQEHNRDPIAEYIWLDWNSIKEQVEHPENFGGVFEPTILRYIYDNYASVIEPYLKLSPIGKPFFPGEKTAVPKIDSAPASKPTQTPLFSTPEEPKAPILPTNTPISGPPGGAPLLADDKKPDDKEKKEIKERTEKAVLNCGTYTIKGKKHEFGRTEDALKIDLDKQFFAVYDGHSNHHCSEYLAANLDKNINTQDVPKNPKEIIEKAFSKTNAGAKNTGGGSTAIVIIVQNGIIYAANVGDSRAVLARDGQAIALSKDQKPYSNAEEKARLEKLGANVTKQKGVEGFWIPELKTGYNHVSRAFGRIGAVEPIPDVQQFAVTDKDQFIIIASDGLWDVFTNQQAIEYVAKLLKEGNTLDDAAKAISKEAVSKGSKDDITVIIVPLDKLQIKEAEPVKVAAPQEKPADIDESATDEQEQLLQLLWQRLERERAEKKKAKEDKERKERERKEKERQLAENA